MNTESVEAVDEELWKFFDEGYVPSKKRAGRYLYIYLRRGQEYVSRGRYTKEKWKHIRMQYSEYKEVMGKDGKPQDEKMTKGRDRTSSSKNISEIVYEAAHKRRTRVDELVQREIRNLKLEYEKLKTERQILEEKLKINKLMTGFSKKTETNHDELRESLLFLLGCSLRELGDDAQPILYFLLSQPRMLDSIDSMIAILYMVEVCKSIKNRLEKDVVTILLEFFKASSIMTVNLMQQMRR